MNESSNTYYLCNISDNITEQKYYVLFIELVASSGDGVDLSEEQKSQVGFHYLSFTNDTECFLLLSALYFSKISIELKYLFFICSLTRNCAVCLSHMGY